MSRHWGLRSRWTVVAGVLTLTLAVADRPAWGRDGVPIVENGRPMAVVEVASGASKQVLDAAKLLVDYVEESSGARLSMTSRRVRPTARMAVISVGLTPDVDARPLDLEDLDDDGFVLRVGADRHIVIAGPSDWGTEFGVYAFLERYVGVRWLLPGEDGDDVPVHETIDVPVGHVREEPAFRSRLFSGLPGEAQSTWARRNRMHGRVSFHHNLNHLFPPTRYTKTHPEFFPIQGGKRYLPPTDNTQHWQPCFSNPATVNEAIKNICAYFEQNPGAASYSLGVNDGGGFCECAKCREAEGKERNFLGRRAMSDLYYGWCNRVIEGVLEKYPGKIFGCLAYSEVAGPPKHTKVNARLIPFMTYDRMKWVHKGIRDNGMRITTQWHDASPVLGWYDYIYGTPYCLPRVWFHCMASYYRFGHQNGVRALYAEAYPNWGEGPKLYVSLRLQWNPECDVDALLQEWFVRAVGEEAAPDLAAYYAHWEDFWTRRILASAWFGEGGQYLRFDAPDYLRDVTSEDLEKSRAWLESAVRKTKTPKQRARADLLLRAYEYYEASAIALSSDVGELTGAVTSEADALHLLDRMQRVMTAAWKRNHLVEEVFASHPVLVHPLKPSRYPLLRGEEGGASTLGHLFEWIAESPNVRARVVELARSCPSPEIRTWGQALLVLTAQDPPRPLSKDPSFERGARPWRTGWSPWIEGDKGSMERTAQAARTGRYGIACKGIARGGPYQVIPAKPGRYAAVAHVRVPRRVKAGATIELRVTCRDASGVDLPTPSTVVPAAPCEWKAVVLVIEVPPEVRGKPVAKLVLQTLLNGFDPTDEVHVDDVALYRLGDGGG